MSNILNIKIAESPEAAPNYNRDMLDVRAAVIHTAIVVKRGTVSGKPTVDFQIRTADGAEFVAMLTGAIIQNLAAIIQEVQP